VWSDARLSALALAATAAACGAHPRTADPRPRDERADLVVAQDGSGDFRTIQEALDTIPPGNTSPKIVLVRNGVYREKLYVNAGHLSLVGEDRERTRIEFAELRRNWRKDHPDDWGAAVLNIGPEVTDLVLANLTVRNDYGSRNGGEDDHQFAIRSGGNATRIAILDADVRADGGDTLSLWNGTSGLYYHADCAFEGHVDYVCPRGWAYITNSRFYGRNLTASIWHDGSKDRDQKLVIRRSRFDGVPGFPLGRNHRDGQFYLLEATFSANMADRPIYKAQADNPYLWGPRYYYWGCRREGGDFAWFADNLAQAPGAPTRPTSRPRGRSPAAGTPRRRCPRCCRSPRCRGRRTARARPSGASRCAGSPAATRAASASISARRRRLRSARSRRTRRSRRDRWPPDGRTTGGWTRSRRPA
jgi:pectinesterase